MTTPTPAYVTLEEAKRQLTARIGICRKSLHNLGYVAELRKRGHYRGRQRTPDGGLTLRCFGVPVTAVAEVAALAEQGGPLPD